MIVKNNDRFAIKTINDNNIKNIGIITFVFNDHNYGQRIQNYALQEFIKKIGDYNVCTYDYRNISDLVFHPLSPNNYEIVSDNQKFIDFEEKYMNFKKFDSIDAVKADNSNIDLYIIGGDQVFNKRILDINCGIDMFFIPWVQKNKKISYSGSDNGFLKTISDKSVIAKMTNLKYLSFREQQTTNEFKNAHTDVDPVFLLDVEDYLKIMKKPSFIKDGEEFIFRYSLHHHGILNSYEYYDANGNKVYNCAGQNCRLKYSVEEWLWMLYNAKEIITNSFHGVALGILFNKKIVCDDLNFRIKNLLDFINIKSIDNIIYPADLSCLQSKIVESKTNLISIITNKDKNDIIVDSKIKYASQNLCMTTNNIYQQVGTNIQKNIFFIWFGKLPEYAKFAVETFKKINPKFNVHTYFYEDPLNSNNDDIQTCIQMCNTPGTLQYKLLHTDFEKNMSDGRYSKNKQLISNVQLSDALRYYLLNKYGGIYLDCDTFPVKRFDYNLLEIPFSVALIRHIPQITKTIYFRDSFFMGFNKGFIDKNFHEFNEYNDLRYIFKRYLFNYVDPIGFEPLGLDIKKFNMFKQKFIDKKIFFGERLYDAFKNDMINNIFSNFNNYEHNYYVDHFFIRTWNDAEQTL